MTETATSNRSKPRTTDQRFVEVWETSKSVAEVAETLNMTLNNCYTRANKLRKLLEPTGQTLKTHGREGKDVNGLADFIATLKAGK